MMKSSLALIIVAIAGGMTLGQHLEPANGKPKVIVLSERDVSEKLDGKAIKATTVEVTFEPGQASMPHRHPGPVFGYILEGEYEWAIDGEPAKKLKRGDTFYEPAMCLHRVSRNLSAKNKARILAVLLVPRDAKMISLPEPAFAQPPVRKFDDPGSPPFKVLKTGENPPLDVDGNYVIGPEYKTAPERKVAQGVSQGKVKQFTIDSKETKLFNPGIARKGFGKVDPNNPKTLIVETHPVDYKRQITVYIPAQYVAGTEAPFMVCHDGPSGKPNMGLPHILDNLIAQKRVPPIIAIMIANGGGDAQGNERGKEYDTMSGMFADYIETEVLPRVEKTCEVKLTKDPDGRAAMGNSSGGSAALIMAWYRPNLYHRVLTTSGTFVNQQWPFNPDTPGGAWDFHETIIPNSPKKPIRIFISVGDRDLLNPNDMRDGMHDWVEANNRMAKVLKAKGYHYQYLFCRNAGHSVSNAQAQFLPHAIEWVWQGYAPKKSGAQKPVSNGGAALWKELRTLRGHHCGIWCVAFSPDGKLLATSTPGYLGPPGEFKIWDLASGRETLSVEAGRSVRCVSFAPDGKSFVTAEPAGQGAALVREISTGNVIHTLVGHTNSIDSLAYSADGKWLATTGLDKTVIIWDPATGQEVKKLLSHKGPVYAVAFSPDGKRLLSGDATGVAILWDAESGKQLQVLSGHSKAVQAVAFSKDNKTLATASWDTTAKLWNADTGKEIATLTGHTNAVLNIMFSPDGRTLVSSGGQWGDRTPGDVVTTSTEVILWDVVTCRAITTLRGHTDRIFGVAFSPDGNFLATTSFDKTVKIWKGFRPHLSATPPSSKELASLWEQLAGDDVGKASMAVDVLAGAPKQAIPFLGKRLLAVKPDKMEKHIAALIGQLDDDHFDLRQKASQELAKLGYTVLPQLKLALAKGPTPEVKQSIEGLLANMTQTELPKEQRRWQWAIMALELAGTLEARKMLQEIANGNAGAWLAQEAHASLKRLDKGAN